MELQTLLDKWEKKVRKSSKKVCGIHIRQGDYKSYRNGQWFLEIDVYFNRARAEVSALGWDDVAFFVASETHVELPSNEHGLWHPSLESAILDMYALARCDMIIGVPSTFSGWSSFIGNKPFHNISNSDECDSLNRSVWIPRLY